MASNAPTWTNFMTIACRYLAGDELYPTNPTVTDIDPFEPTRYMDYDGMKNELLQLCPGSQLILLDTKYAIPSKEYFDTFLKKNKVDEIEWVKNYCDCDNISLLLWVSMKVLNPDTAIGVVIGKTPSGGSHMWVIARTSHGLVEIEPQNDRELDPEKYTEKIIIM